MEGAFDQNQKAALSPCVDMGDEQLCRSENGGYFNEDVSLWGTCGSFKRLKHQEMLYHCLNPQP